MLSQGNSRSLPFYLKAPSRVCGWGWEVRERKELFDLGTCAAAPFWHAFSRMWETTNPTEKQHHRVPVWMLPLKLGPLANSTIPEWKIPSISFRWCNIALGHCRKTETLKYFKGLNEYWASFFKLKEQCNTFFFFLPCSQTRYSKENQSKGLKWTCLLNAYSSAQANFCRDNQLRKECVSR